MIFYLAIMLIFLSLYRCLSIESSFHDITLLTSSSNIKESITFTLEFVLNRDFTNEVFVFRLPRFFGNSTSNLKMSPSTLLDATWVQGDYLNYTDINGLGGINDISQGIPYDNSELIVQLKDSVSFSNRTKVSISIYSSNNIGVYCGMPSSDAFYSTAYQQRLVTESILTLPLMSSRAVLADGSLGAFTTNFVPFGTFPAMGHDGFDCSYLNYCSGHGVCDYCNQVCICDEGYGRHSDLVSTGSASSFAALSCSARTCPAGKAIGDLASGPTTAHAMAECSNQGRCNRNTGVCSCYPPFEGPACNEMTCPSAVPGKVCSGHGVCWTMAEIASSDAISAPTVYGSTSLARNTVAWDSNIIKGCVCNSSWPVGYGAFEYQLSEYFLPDCSLRRCPSGNNPYTCEDEEDCEGLSQQVQAGGTGVLVGAHNNRCHRECSDRGFCNRNNGTCTCFEGSTGENCNMTTTGELPDCAPSGQPTSQPTNTYTPTSEPSGQPSSAPTSFPTGVLYLPSNLTACTLVNNSETRSSVTLNCSLDIYAFDPEAMVYCAPYPVLTDPNSGAVTHSVPNNADDVIRFQQYSQSFGGKAFVTVGQLAPTTTYDFYCASVTKVLVKSPIQDILHSQVLGVKTVCCKILTVNVRPQPIVEGAFRVNGLSLSLSHLPSWGITIDIAISNFNDPGDTHVLSNITVNPSSIVVGNTNSLLQYGLDVVTQPGSVDFTYIFNALISGDSAAEYVIQYSNLHTVTIVAADVVPAVPQLERARFSDNGGSVIVDFDSLTDQGAYGSGVFTCGLILAFVGNTDSHCQWAGASQIIITPALSVTPNVTTIAVVADVLKAQCTDSPAFPCSTWAYVLTDPILIDYPLNPVVPNVIIMGPAIINSCTDLVIDIGSASTGSGGRDWLYSRPSFSLRSTTATSPAALMTFLNTNYVMLPPSPIAGSLLQVGASYTFGVTLCNVFNSCGTTEYYLYVSEDMQVPTISILGSPFRTIKTKDPVLLNTNIYRALCNNQVAYTSLNYSWSIWPGGKQTLPGGVVIGTESFIIVSTSVDETKYELPAYTLSPNSFYSIYVAVTDAVTTSVVETFVTITVEPGDIITKMAGGSSLYVRYGGSLTIDGRDSYDEDLGPVAAIDGSTREGLTFQWTCVALTPVYGANCPYAFSAAAASGADAVQFTLTAPFVTGVPSSVYLGVSAKILLTVSDIVGSRSTDAQAEVFTINSLAPAIDINKNSIVNPIDLTQQVVLSAFVSSTYDCLAQWSFNESSLLLSSISSTNTSSIVYRNTPKKVYLVVSAYSLAPRFTYLFSLVCNPYGPPNVNISTPLAPASSVVVITNGPPQFGTFKVTPTMGGVSLDTQFLFLTASWLDEELPLSIEFGFISSTASVSKKNIIKGHGKGSESLFRQYYSPVRSQKETSYGYSILPPGTPGIAYNLTTVAKIYDALGNPAVVYQDVQVLPYGSQPDSSTGGSSGSSLNNATALLSLLTAAGSMDTNYTSEAQTLSFIDISKQVLSVFSDVVNAVNCTLAPDAFCATLNRDSCGALSHTCGECLDGTVGTLGHGNTLCVAADDSLLTDTAAQAAVENSPCISDSDCGGWYTCSEALLCAIPTKHCHNNCTGIGECQYIITDTGVLTPTCLSNDATCSAICSCADGYSGTDCSFHSSDYETMRTIRATLLSRLANLTAVETPIPSVLSSWATSVASISSTPLEMSNLSTTLVYNTADKIITTAKTIDLPYTAITPVLAAIDSSMEYTTLTYPVTVTPTNDVYSVLGLGDVYAATLNVSVPLIQAFTDMVVAVAVPGQPPVEAIYNTFRLASVAVADETENVYTTTLNPVYVATTSPNTELSVPRTALEISTGVNTSQLSMASNQFYLSALDAHPARRVRHLVMSNPVASSLISGATTAAATDTRAAVMDIDTLAAIGVADTNMTSVDAYAGWNLEDIWAAAEIRKNDWSRRLAVNNNDLVVENNGVVNTGGAVALISVRIQQYGGVDRQFKSNPLTIQAINLKDVDSTTVVLSTVNERPETYATLISNLTYTTVCTPYKPETFIYPCTLDFPPVVHVCENIEKSMIMTSSCVTVVQRPIAINIVGVNGQTNNDAMRVPKREAAIANGTVFPPSTNCTLLYYDSINTVSSCNLGSMVNTGPVSPPLSSFTRRRRRLAAGLTTASGAALPLSETYYPMVAMKQSTIHENIVPPHPIDDTLSPAPLVYALIGAVLVIGFVISSLIILKYEFHQKFSHAQSKLVQKEVELAKVLEVKAAKASAQAHTSALSSILRGASTAPSVEAATALAAKKAKERAKIKLKLAIKEYMNHILPPVFRIYPSYWISTSVGHWFARRKLEDIYTHMWKIVVEIYNNHRYVRCFRTPHTAAEKTRNFVSVMYTFSVVTMILLLGVIFYELDAGPNDGSCKHHFDEQSCIARKSQMNRDKNYCAWIERSYLNSVPVHVCVYNDITFNNITSTYTGIIIAVLLGIYQAILEVPYRVLTAQTADVELYEAAEVRVNKHLNTAWAGSMVSPFMSAQGANLSEEEFVNLSAATPPPTPTVMERMVGAYYYIQWNIQKLVLRLLLLLYSNDGRNASKRYAQATSGHVGKDQQKRLRMGVGVDGMSSVVNKLNEHLDTKDIRRKSWVGEISDLSASAIAGAGAGVGAGAGPNKPSLGNVSSDAGKADDVRAATATADNTIAGAAAGTSVPGVSVPTPPATGVGSPGYKRPISTVRSPVVMLSTPMSPHRPANRLSSFMNMNSGRVGTDAGDTTTGASDVLIADRPYAQSASPPAAAAASLSESTIIDDSTAAPGVTQSGPRVSAEPPIVQPVVFNFLPNADHGNFQPVPSLLQQYQQRHQQQHGHHHHHSSHGPAGENISSVGVFTFMDNKPALPPTPPEEVELLPQSLSDFYLYNTGLKDLSGRNARFNVDVADAKSKMLCYYYIHNTHSSGADTNIEDQITTLEHVTEVFNKWWLSRYDKKTRRFAINGLGKNKVKGLGALGGGGMAGVAPGLLVGGHRAGGAGRGKRNSVMGAGLFGAIAPKTVVELEPESEFINFDYDQLLKDIQSQYEALQQLYYTISASRAMVVEAHEAAMADNSDTEQQSENSASTEDVEDLEERRKRFEEELLRLDEDEADATKKVYGFLEVWHLVLQKASSNNDAKAIAKAAKMQRRQLKSRKKKGRVSGDRSRSSSASNSDSDSDSDSSGSDSSSDRNSMISDGDAHDWQENDVVCAFSVRSQLKLRKLLLHTQELLQEKVQLLSSIIDGSSSMWAAVDTEVNRGIDRNGHVVPSGASVHAPHAANTMVDTLGHGASHSHSPTKHNAKLDNLTTGDGGEGGRIGIGVGVELMHLFIMDLLGSISVVDSSSIIHSRQASRESSDYGGRPDTAESFTARIMDQQAATLKNHIITTNRNASNPSVNPITRVFEMKVQEDFLQVFTVTMMSKIVSTVAIVGVNLACIAYVLLRASVRQERWQVMFAVAAIVQFIMECFVNETLIVFIVHYWLPNNITHQKIKPIYNLITELMLDLFDHDDDDAAVEGDVHDREQQQQQQQQQQQRERGTASVAHPTTMHVHDFHDDHDDVSVYGDEANHIQRSTEPNAVEVKVNVPSYLYISTMLAQQFSHLLEAQVIISFETYRPNAELSSKWDDNHFDRTLEAQELVLEERELEMEHWYRDHEYRDFDEFYDEDEGDDIYRGSRNNDTRGRRSGNERGRGRGHRHTLFARRPERRGRTWFSRLLHFFDCSYKSVVKHVQPIVVFPIYKAQRYADHRLVKGRELPLGEYYSLSMLLLWGLFQIFGVANLSIAHMTATFKIVVPILMSTIALCYTRNVASANIAIFISLFVLHFGFYYAIQKKVRRLGYKFIDWYKEVAMAAYPYSKHVYRWGLQGAMFVAWIIRRVLRGVRKYYRYCCSPRAQYGAVAPDLPRSSDKVRPETASSEDTTDDMQSANMQQQEAEREFLSDSDDDTAEGEDEAEAQPQKPIAGFNLDSDDSDDDDDLFHQEFSFKHSEEDPEENREEGVHDEDDSQYDHQHQQVTDSVGNWGDNADDDDDDEVNSVVLESLRSPQSSVAYSPAHDGSSPWKSPPASIGAEEQKRRLEAQLEAEYADLITAGHDSADQAVRQGALHGAIRPPEQPLHSPTGAASPHARRKIIKPPDNESIMEDGGYNSSHSAGTGRSHNHNHRHRHQMLVPPPAGQHPYGSSRAAAAALQSENTIALTDFASPEPMSQSFASSIPRGKDTTGDRHHTHDRDTSVISDMHYSGALHNQSFVDSMNNTPVREPYAGTPKREKVQMVDFTPQQQHHAHERHHNHNLNQSSTGKKMTSKQTPKRIAHEDTMDGGAAAATGGHHGSDSSDSDSNSDADISAVNYSVASSALTPPPVSLAGTNPWNGHAPAPISVRSHAAAAGTSAKRGGFNRPLGEIKSPGSASVGHGTMKPTAEHLAHSVGSLPSLGDDDSSEGEYISEEEEEDDDRTLRTLESPSHMLDEHSASVVSPIAGFDLESDDDDGVESLEEENHHIDNVPVFDFAGDGIHDSSAGGIGDSENEDDHHEVLIDMDEAEEGHHIHTGFDMNESDDGIDDD